MSHHPWGQTVEIFGTESPTNGHCCEEHTICGAVLTEDSVVRLRKVQVIINEKEESAIVAFWVSDRVDRCHVRFLLRHHVKHWMKLEGVLGQIMEETQTAQPSIRNIIGTVVLSLQLLFLVHCLLWNLALLKNIK